MRMNFSMQSHYNNRSDDIELLAMLCERTLKRIVSETPMLNGPNDISIATRVDIFTFVEGRTDFDFYYYCTMNYRSEEKFSQYGAVLPFSIRKLGKLSDDGELKEYCSDGDYRVAIQVSVRGPGGAEMVEVEKQVREQFKKVLHIAMIDTDFIMAYGR